MSEHWKGLNKSLKSFPLPYGVFLLLIIRLWTDITFALSSSINTVKSGVSLKFKDTNLGLTLVIVLGQCYPYTYTQMENVWKIPNKFKKNQKHTRSWKLVKRLEVQVCQGKRQWNKGIVKKLAFFVSILCTAAQHFFQSQCHSKRSVQIYSAAFFSLFRFLACSLILSSSLMT